MTSNLRPWALRTGSSASGVSASGDSASSDDLDSLSISELQNNVATAEADGAIDVDGRFLWGFALMAAGQLDEAGDAFALALSVPDAPGRLHVLAAVVHDSMGRELSRDVLEGLEAHLKSGTDREIPALWMSVGALLAQAGLLDRAGSAFNRAAEAYSKSSDMDGVVHALRESALLAARNGRLPEAAALLQRARRYSSNDETSVLLRLDEAHLEALQGRWAPCVSALASAQALSEKALPADHPLLDRVLISLAAAKMEVSGASLATERLLDRVLGNRSARFAEDSPELAEVLLLLGEHHRLSGRLDDALPLLGRAAHIRDHRGEGRESIAHAYLVWSQALADKGLVDAASAKRERAESLLAAAS